MPEDKELEQRQGESKPDIASLRKQLRELFEKHIKENKGQPLFASDIEDLAERAKWEERQVAQWNARHAVLSALKGIGERAWEEIHRDNAVDMEYRPHYDLEWRQRWLTPEGREFLDAIIAGLNEGENLWDDARGDNQVGLIFGDVEIAGGKKYADFHYVHWSKDRWYRDLCLSDLRGVILTKANLQRAYLWRANLQGTVLWHANLQVANITQGNLQRAHLERADLLGADLREATLRDSYLAFANLRGAILWDTKLQGANLRWADLQGADLSGATIAGAVLKITGPENSEKEQEIHERSVNFAKTMYSREWHGPLWAAFLWSFLTCVLSPITSATRFVWRGIVEWKWKWEWMRREKFAWEREHTLRNNVLNWLKKQNGHKMAKLIGRIVNGVRWAKEGRPTTFLGVDTSGLDASKNPGLKRDIDDEQFIADFKAKNRFIYKLWAWSSDCGRSIALWAFWCFLAIFIFAGLYCIPGMVEIADVKVPSGFLGNLYSSLLTFATFGFGSITPAGGWGTLAVSVEVICGYIFFGGLVALFTSTLTRRA